MKSYAEAASNLGLRAFDSLRTILQREGEYYLSHENLGFALMVLHPDTAVLMQWPEEGAIAAAAEPTPVWSAKSEPELTPQIVAGFFEKHPKAVVSLSDGRPIILCCPDHPEFKKVYTFEALQEGVAAGFQRFGCAVPRVPA